MGFQETGSVVEVTLSGTEANVQLLDSTALTNYKARRSYQYVGGHYRQSPVRLSVPHAGVWYVIVDLGRYVGTVRSAVRVISPLTARGKYRGFESAATGGYRAAGGFLPEDWRRLTLYNGLADWAAFVGRPESTTR